jgi:hypothetical protein
MIRKSNKAIEKLFFKLIFILRFNSFRKLIQLQRKRNGIKRIKIICLSVRLQRTTKWEFFSFIYRFVFDRASCVIKFIQQI